MRIAAQLLVVALSATTAGLEAHAWGRQGHMLVGMAAERILCEAAAGEVARLGNGESLGLIGQWADEIRGQPQWRQAAPWHYVNIEDDGDPRSPAVTAAGNVVVAIERFSGELRDPMATDAVREVALRFLVHFIGDIHQPLHVGRERDRGGNLIDVAYADIESNLHAFWDTGSIRLRSLPVAEYADSIAARVEAAALRDRDTQVRDWAAQVFAVRPRVYDFDSTTGILDADYLAMAADLAQQQLILASAHLANTLNDMFCE